MQVILVLCFLFVCAYSAPTFDVKLDAPWNLYKQRFEKKYKSLEEEIHRRTVWEENLDFIRKHNLEADLGLHSYTVGMNKYGDLSNAEFNKQINTVKPSLRNQTRGFNRRTFEIPVNFHLPDSVDWSQQGYVTEVKDQGQCGSCWAFSATGALEGQHFAQSGQLVSLSEQNLVDCSGQYGNQGCNGGRPDWAFHYVQDNGGIDTEDSYSYETAQDSCRYNPGNSGATDNGFVEIPEGDENALQTAIANVGPISVLIDASQQSFQMYQDGVYNEPACSQTSYDHAVLAVGYGSDGGQDFYIVKNSWGSSWGRSGYILMSRNNNNQCAIAQSACYPTV